MERHMKRRMAATAAALALAVGGVGLSACGGSDSSGSAASTAVETTAQAPNGIEKLTAKEILQTSRDAASAASSVKISGAISQGGEEIALDMTLGKDSGEGSITAQGVEVDLKFVGGKAYLKASGEDFAKLVGGSDSAATGEALAALIGDKWLAVPTDENSSGEADGLESFRLFGEKDSLLEGILEPDGEVTVKGTGTVNGTPVVFLDSSEGEGTLAISTVGEPYPLQIKGTGSGSDSGTGEVNFTDWNAPISVTAPTDVVDLGALANLGGGGTSSTSG
jgi:hypothetical protein